MNKGLLAKTFRQKILFLKLVKNELRSRLNWMTTYDGSRSPCARKRVGTMAARSVFRKHGRAALHSCQCPYQWSKKSRRFPVGERSWYAETGVGGSSETESFERLGSGRVSLYILSFQIYAEANIVEKIIGMGPSEFLQRIENKIDPGPPMDKDLYSLPPEELADVPNMPGSLNEALDALERDHAFLTKGDVYEVSEMGKGQGLEASAQRSLP